MRNECSCSCRIVWHHPSEQCYFLRTGPSVLLDYIFRHGFLQLASKNALAKSFKKETKLTHVLWKSAVNTKHSSPTWQQSGHIQYSSSFVHYSLSASYSNVLEAGHCECWTFYVWRPTDKERRATPLWGRNTSMPTMHWYSVRISSDPKHPSLLLGDKLRALPTFTTSCATDCTFIFYESAG